MNVNNLIGITIIICELYMLFKILARLEKLRIIRSRKGEIKC